MPRASRLFFRRSWLAPHPPSTPACNHGRSPLPTLRPPSPSGVPPGSATLADPAMELLINEYCREAGVRNLKKHLEKV